MSNANQMMKQVQAMQRKLTKAQDELNAKEVSGSAGGGVVTATVNGSGSAVLQVSINPEAVDPDDVEMLQDMVVAAVNEALRAAKELESQVMGGIAGGLGLPPGML